uniref:Uncharacterized protein n=1 Tax=Arundo donax TaxID=35708 RepID=A0A0A8Y4R9_ARUDO
MINFCWIAICLLVFSPSELSMISSI